jgi:DNA-binding CsgD family transcriptional regulator
MRTRGRVAYCTTVLTARFVVLVGLGCLLLSAVLTGWLEAGAMRLLVGHGWDSSAALQAARAMLTLALAGLLVLAARVRGRPRPPPSPASPMVVGRPPPAPPTRRSAEGGLTARELEVLRLMATSSMTYREIAGQLVVGEETVRTHAKNILRKLNQPDRRKAVLAAAALGLV